MVRVVEKKQHVIHFNEMLHVLAIAEERRQLVNIKAWKSTGEIVVYKGWLVHHDYWKKGFVRLRNPLNNEIRAIPEIYIFEINNHQVYL
ncbi:hypothetical protein HMPREF3034_00041 [Prevotella sp. DNF00663]|nr:hypothetical protein HMPREF3034_00041 [Prevotella sp. DNF00663]